MPPPKPVDLAEILPTMKGWKIKLKLQTWLSLWTLRGLNWPKLHVDETCLQRHLGRGYKTVVPSTLRKKLLQRGGCCYGTTDDDRRLQMRSKNHRGEKPRVGIHTSGSSIYPLSRPSRKCGISGSGTESILVYELLAADTLANEKPHVDFSLSFRLSFLCHLFSWRVRQIRSHDDHPRPSKHKYNGSKVWAGNQKK